ncbi:hypothetical protein ACFQ3Z_34155 [Streptomyces nogalater]
MAALEESQGRTRDQRSVFERYQDAAADAGELESSLFSVEVTADGLPTDIEREETEGGVIEDITSPSTPSTSTSTPGRRPSICCCLGCATR